MDDKEAGGCLPSEMSPFQAQFPDIRQLYGQNPQTAGQAPSPQKEGCLHDRTKVCTVVTPLEFLYRNSWPSTQRICTGKQYYHYQWGSREIRASHLPQI